MLRLQVSPNAHRVVRNGSAKSRAVSWQALLLLKIMNRGRAGVIVPVLSDAIFHVAACFDDVVYSVVSGAPNFYMYMGTRTCIAAGVIFRCAVVPHVCSASNRSSFNRGCARPCTLQYATRVGIPVVHAQAPRT